MRGYIEDILDVTHKGKVVAVVQRNVQNGGFIWHTIRVNFVEIKKSKAKKAQWRSVYFEDGEKTVINCFSWLVRHSGLSADEFKTSKHAPVEKPKPVLKTPTRRVMPSDIERQARLTMSLFKDLLTPAASKADQAHAG